MRCTACGAELVLTQVVPDATNRGFEHHTFVCSACHVTEHRMLFMRHGREDDEPMPIHEAPPTVPASNSQEQHTAAPGLLSRVIARIRGH